MISTARFITVSLSRNSHRFSWLRTKRLDDFTERHVLPGPACTNFAIAIFDIEFMAADQPLAQMAINFVNAFPQFRGRNMKMSYLTAGVNFPFQSPGECIDVSFDQTNESVRKHHHHRSFSLILSHAAQLHTSSLSAAAGPIQPSTGIFTLSTVGSIVCGTVMAREIMHPDCVRRNSRNPASI